MKNKDVFCVSSYNSLSTFRRKNAFPARWQNGKDTCRMCEDFCGRCSTARQHWRMAFGEGAAGAWLSSPLSANGVLAFRPAHSR